MSDRAERPDLVPDFEIVLWGYDRREVDRCLVDMTARLEEALCRLDSMEMLAAQLTEAQLEIDQLRRSAEQRPSVANRISLILKSAEELHDQARQRAATVRTGLPAGPPAGPEPPGAGAPAE